MKPNIIIAVAIGLLAGCAATPQAQSNSAPQTTVSQKLSELRIGMSKNEVIATIGQPDRYRTEENADGQNEIWLYSRDTLTARIEGSGASFMAGFRRGIAQSGSDAPVELRFKDGKITTIVNR